LRLSGYGFTDHVRFSPPEFNRQNRENLLLVLATSFPGTGGYDHRRSTCITTNRVFKDWTKVFPDPLNAQVIAERLTERAEVFLMDGKKFRDPRNHETA